MGGSAPQRIHDLVEMPLRVFLGHRVPNDFLAKNAVAIQQGGHLPITATQIETDATPIEVSAQRRCIGARLGNFFGLNDRHFKRTLIDSISHDSRIEPACGCFAIVLLQSNP
jgi:hypothetical protein